MDQAFAPYLGSHDRNGATLTAEISAVFLGSNTGTGVGGSSQDTIEGVLLVHGPRGSVAASTPLRAITSYFQTPVDQPLREQSNHERVVALAQSFARWAPKELGL